MSSNLNLYFFHFDSIKVKKYKLSFKNIIEDIKTDNLNYSTTISIPENIFKDDTNQAIIDITLYDDSSNSENFKFNIYNGKNSVYIQTDELSDYVFAIILRNMKNAKIELFRNELNGLYNLGNEGREKFCLINCMRNFIYINGEYLHLNSIIFKNSLEPEITFNKIIVLDLKAEKFIVQPIKDKIEYYIQFLKDNKDLLINFETNYFNNFFKSDENNYQTIHQNIVDKFKIIKNHPPLDLNTGNNNLNEIFNKNEFLDLELFWDYYLCKFFFDTNNIQHFYYKRNIILNIIEKIKELKNQLNQIKELPLYEKVRTVYSLLNNFLKPEEDFLKLNEIEKLNLRFFLTNKKEVNSILDRSYKFYQNFITNISEDRAIFPYLLKAYNGCGYHDRKEVCNIDLKNLDMIKNYLRQVYPQVIVFCHIENDDIILKSEHGILIINEFYLTKIQNLDYNSSTLPQITEEQKDDIAVNIFLEIIKHKFLNKKNDIMILTHNNEDEYILTNMNTEKGDFGYYPDLCYGKYTIRIIIYILRNMENKGKIIRNPRLFTDDLKILNE